MHTCIASLHLRSHGLNYTCRRFRLPPFHSTLLRGLAQGHEESVCKPIRADQYARWSITAGGQVDPMLRASVDARVTVRLFSWERKVDF